MVAELDFNKDDKLIANPPYSPLKERVSAVINDHADRTGKKVMYACNVSGEVDEMLRAYRVTTEQMAILEAALVESLTASSLTIIREGMDEAVRMGYPKQAVRDFLFCHFRIELAIIFDQAGFPFSDGALSAISQAKNRIFRSDWKQVMALENVKKSVSEVADA